MDPFHTWTSSSTLTNPLLSTENQLTPTFMSATIPVPPHPPKTVLSDPLQDKPTSYAPPTLAKGTRHSLYHLLKKWTPPDRVRHIMDTGQCQTKTRQPNKLALNQFNIQLKCTTLSFATSFPFHPTIIKKIKISLESHDIKVTSSSWTTYSPKRRQHLHTSLPTSSTKFLVMTVLPPSGVTLHVGAPPHRQRPPFWRPSPT